MYVTALSEQHKEFQGRIMRIQRTHDAMSTGIVFRLGPDGVIRPEARSPRRSFPVLRVMLIVLAMLFFVKAFTFQFLGAETYQQRWSELAEGHTLEKIGAIVMTPDRGTRWLAGKLERVRS